MTTAAVQFEGVAKSYPHFTLDSIDLVLPHGQIMGFIGPNGAGKSTTIRILMGLVHQDRGSVQVLGHAMPGDQAAAKRQVGFASTEGSARDALLGRAVGAHAIDLERAVPGALEEKTPIGNQDGVSSRSGRSCFVMVRTSPEATSIRRTCASRKSLPAERRPHRGNE